MIRVVSSGRVALDNQEVFKSIAKELVAKTILEKGCIEYGLHADEADPEILVFFEVWETRADLDAHMQTAHFKELGAKMGKYRTDRQLLILSPL